ncbi:MAG: hypothetical protein COA79_10040 [Planctomycetota bacterium]|nr:MAG: hypothetical protein COA79_10040 [Planctomycetota bacterium]
MKNIPTELLSDSEFKKRFENFDVQTSDQIPTQMSLEANIIQFPLVSFKGDSRKERIWKREICDENGNIETTQELKFLAPGDMKLANGIIDRKLQILSFHLWQKYGSQESGTFWFTLRGLAEFLQIAPNGKNLKRIKEAMGRLQMTSIISTNAMTKKTDSGELVTKSAEGYLNFFSNLQFISTNTGQTNDIENSKNLSFAQIHKFFINNFMREYSGKIDLNLTLKLKQPASIGLYFLLCSQSVNEDSEIFVSLNSLIENIPLDPNKNKVADYDRILGSTFSELIKYGVIENIEKKERKKSAIKRERKIDRVYYLIKISKEVREIQLSMFPETPAYDESFEIDPLLSQMISLSGLNEETAKKIMNSKEFNLSSFEDAIDVMVYNQVVLKKDISLHENYLNKLVDKKATLKKDQKVWLSKNLENKESKNTVLQKSISLRPIPSEKDDLIIYLTGLGMWDNKAKNICNNQPIDKIVLQINGWLIKHKDDDLKSNIRELVSACESEEGYETFNSTAVPDFSGNELWQIKGYNKQLVFKQHKEAEKFCEDNNISPLKIYQSNP